MYRYRKYYIPDYMMNGLELYIDRGVLPGSFLTAVLENDLKEAVSRADDTNIDNLPAYMAYLYNEAPAECYGSPERVTEWVKKKQSQPILSIVQ